MPDVANALHSLPDPGRSRTYEVTRASKEAANNEAALAGGLFHLRALAGGLFHLRDALTKFLNKLEVCRPLYYS